MPGIIGLGFVRPSLVASGAHPAGSGLSSLPRAHSKSNRSFERKLVGTAASTTMTTANLRAAMQNAYLAVFAHDREATRRTCRFASVIGAFLAGAVAAAWLTAKLGTHAVWVPAGLLALYLVPPIHDEYADGRHATSHSEAG
ncbi:MULTISPECIES: DUF1275 family protein [unclassified Streptomyces]|uniref:DUF1275 family protein n=1 Tax=unclassified Streptomyces TaxID=2593676 RepID=UPI003D904B33